MTLRRTMSALLLNEVANRPDVRPFLGGAPEALDLWPLAMNPEVYVLEGDGGAFVLTPLMEGVYELHTVFGPEGRGKSFFAAAAKMFRFMFAETPALEIVTKCPDNNAGARLAAGRVGFRERFRREKAWASELGGELDTGVSFRVFSVDDWFVRDSACLAEGQAFHAMLEAVKEREALTEVLPVHEDDDAHDRAVGAALLMAKAGLMAKGVGFYNRWALFAGYAPIHQVGPHVVNIQDAIVEVRNGETGVLTCLSERLPPA